jgi:hypothetical protein
MVSPHQARVIRFGARHQEGRSDRRRTAASCPPGRHRSPAPPELKRMALAAVDIVVTIADR